MTKEQIQADLDALPANYKTSDVDRLIASYVREKTDVSCLRPYILSEQQFHRIYFYVSLKQMKNVNDRVAFIDSNLLFSDWWHTDQLIKFVADMDINKALAELYWQEESMSRVCETVFAWLDTSDVPLPNLPDGVEWEEE